MTILTWMCEPNDRPLSINRHSISEGGDVQGSRPVRHT